MLEKGDYRPPFFYLLEIIYLCLVFTGANLYEGNHPRWRKRHTALSPYAKREQAAPAGVR